MLRNMENTKHPGTNGAQATAELAELLTRSSWRLKKSERKELTPFGLTFAQARALRVLVEVGAMRIGDLANFLEIVPRSATTRVDDLEAAGLVARSMDPDDRRSIVVTPTQQGRELVARLAAERRASAEALFSPLSGAERTELLGLLRSIAKDV